MAAKKSTTAFISWRVVTNTVTAALLIGVLFGGLRLYGNDLRQNDAIRAIEKRMDRDLGSIHRDLLGLRAESSESDAALRYEIAEFRKSMTQQLTETRTLLMEILKERDK